MGLDMFVFKTKIPVPDVDYEEPEVSDIELLQRWRKHDVLHHWMRNLYELKGGMDDCFNCVTVSLDAYDLADLEQDIDKREIRYPKGYGAQIKAKDLAFIAAARQAIHQGFYLYYVPWW